MERDRKGEFGNLVSTAETHHLKLLIQKKKTKEKKIIYGT